MARSVNSGGTEDVKGGGAANGTAVNSGGFQYVEVRGGAIGTTVSGGAQTGRLAPPRSAAAVPNTSMA